MIKNKLFLKNGKSLLRLPFNFDDVFSVFIPEKGYLITPLLIDFNLFVFMVMAAKGVNILSPTDQDLIKWGANLRVLTMDGLWWRLITNCFVHSGVLSLLLNMSALYFIGKLLEPRLGPVGYAATYFLLVLFSSAFSIYWNVYTISMGTSGVIFGLCGVFLAMITTNTVQRKVPLSLLISIVVFAGYNIIVSYNIIKPINGHIDNAANIGGLFCGLIIGYGNYFSLTLSENNRVKYITLAIILVLISGSSYVLYAKTPRDIITYQNNLGIITDMESAALKYYNLPLDAPKEAKIAALDSGIYYWNEYLEIARENEKLKLPANMASANKKLLTYGYLRMKCYRFIYSDINQNNTVYLDSILYYNTKIRDIVGSM